MRKRERERRGGGGGKLTPAIVLLPSMPKNTADQMSSV